jgi:hypothetical protein
VKKEEEVAGEKNVEMKKLQYKIWIQKQKQKQRADIISFFLPASASASFEIFQNPL